MRQAKIGLVWGLRLQWFLPIVVAFVSLTPGWAAAASTAPAANRPSGGLQLTTSPLPVTLNEAPGQTVSTELKVKQSSGGPEELQTTLLKFGAQGINGSPALSAMGPTDTYASWVTFDKTKFEAPNNVWQDVKMTIAIPKTAAFEYNYAVEFSRVGDNLYPGGNSEAIAGGSATLVLLNVEAPGMNRSLQLSSFKVEHSVVEFVPETFDVNFYDNGNVYVQPSGDIFITQNNTQVGVVERNDEQGNILAHTHRDFKTQWVDGWPYYAPAEKNGKPELDRHNVQIQALNFGLPPTSGINDNNGIYASSTNSDQLKESSNPISRLRFGEYSARLVAVYTDDFGRDVPVTATITFWVIPWRILLVFLFILLVFGFAVYTLINNAVRRRKRLERLKKKRRPQYL
jgi:hypothetical protein